MQVFWLVNDCIIPCYSNSAQGDQMIKYTIAIKQATIGF